MRFLTLLCFVLTIAMTGGAALAADASELVGRWDQAKSEVAFIRFAEDGTYRWVTPTEQIEGHYRLLTGGVVELSVMKGIAGRKAVEFKYRISGDRLEMKVGTQWVKFKKGEP